MQHIPKKPLSGVGVMLGIKVNDAAKVQYQFERCTREYCLLRKQEVLQGE